MSEKERLVNTLIINGSPKGQRSVTLKTAQYLEKLHPEHTFHYLDAGAHIHALERDFTPAQTELAWADLILFTYPVYTFLAPAQLHRFLELMEENGIRLDGKAGSQITTSKHFFDTTAHAFLSENMSDFGLTTYRGLSADMSDLLSPGGQKQARDFFTRLMFEMERGMGAPPRERPAPQAAEPYAASLENQPKKAGRKVALVYAARETDASLLAMMDDFERALPYEVVRADVSAFPFQGGCLGCLNCAQDGHCIYTDGFEDFLRRQIHGCDATVYAFPIRNHFTYPAMKMFDDRQFCNGHRTVTAGAPVGYLLSGNYADEPNLQTLLEGRASVGGNYFCGVATNEGDTQKSIADLAATLTMALENGLSEPQSFLGAGGSKIFRDLVYGMQGFMRADHQFFKEHGMYDFPQKDKKTLWGMRLVGSLMQLPAVKKKVQPRMSEYMIQPYEKVVSEAHA